VYKDTALNDQSEKIPALFSNTTIAYSPSLSSQGRITWLPLSKLEVTVLGRYISKQFLDNRGQDAYSIPAYALADLRLAYRLPLQKWVRVVQLTAQVNNLGNATYTNNGYVYANQSYIYPQAGRTYWAGLVLSW
jgi:iron complex outermembrane receptor protein